MQKIRCAYDKIVPLSELRLHPKNPNKHPPEQIQRLAEILHYQGVRVPVRVSLLSGFVTGGHGRIAAAKLNGWTEIPVNYQEYESLEQEYADLVADNAIALWAELDLKDIGDQVTEYGPDFDINLLGIEDFVIEPADKFEGDEDAVPEVSTKEALTKRGELYQLGDHRLLCGDSTDASFVERLVNGDKADMVFTDPPYGVSYVGKTKDALTIENDNLSDAELLDLLQKAFIAWPLRGGGAFYVCSPPGKSEFVFRQALPELRQSLVWVKQHFVFGRQDYHWRHESILYGWRDGGAHYFVNDRTQDTVWNCDRPMRSEVHPTMKPVELVERAIKNSSKQNETIFDGFLGSGTTLIASEKAHRKCYGIEIDPHYCDVIIERWQKFTGKEAIREDGVKWADLEVK